MNSMKNDGKNMTCQRVIHNITRNLRLLLMVTKPTQEFLYYWSIIIKELEEVRSSIKVTKVIWEILKAGRVKYNIDGASRGNPEASSYAYYLRNDHGDLLYIKRTNMEDTTNKEVEVAGILQASKHCRLTHHNKVIIQTDSLVLQKVSKWE